jgi:uncharacterized protein YdhG (YjbR/CyaY superfamily)
MKSTVIDEYVAKVAEPARTTLMKVLAVIRATVPKETVEAISYQIPAFKYKGMLIGFGAFPKHCSLFVMNPSVMDQFATELEKYETSKGAIKFPIDRPFPTTLLKRIVKARIAQNEAKG